MIENSNSLRPLVTFLLLTGARISEAVYLDWRNVDLSRGHVQFVKTKNGEPRGVPLHPRVVTELANLPYDREGFVFRYPSGRGKWSPYSDGGGMRTAWANMLKRAGITNFTPHDCRHTWATWGTASL